MKTVDDQPMSLEIPMAENITRKETLDGVTADEQGTGIYWFIDPKGVHEQIFVPRITQGRFQELAEDLAAPGKQKLDAYRWVPDRANEAGVLVMQSCGSKTCNSNLDCIDNACRCIDGLCRRK
jgi:hypothetical protein